MEGQREPRGSQQDDGGQHGCPRIRHSSAPCSGKARARSAAAAALPHAGRGRTLDGSNLLGWRSRHQGARRHRLEHQGPRRHLRQGGGRGSTTARQASDAATAYQAAARPLAPASCQRRQAAPAAPGPALAAALPGQRHPPPSRALHAPTCAPLPTRMLPRMEAEAPINTLSLILGWRSPCTLPVPDGRGEGGRGGPGRRGSAWGSGAY